MRVIVIVLIGGLVITGIGLGYVHPEWRSRLFDTPPTAMIIDDKGLFDEDAKAYLRSYHQMLLDRFDLDYRIVITSAQADLDTFAHQLFERLNVGQYSQNHRGVLLVIDPEQDRVRLDVSANLEPVMTDAFVSYLEHRQMVPFFKVNRVADGIFATSEIIRTRLLEAQQGKEFDLAKVMGSRGGGAKTKAQINAGKEMDFKTGQPEVRAAPDPQETLRRYIQALSARNGRSDLDVFTPETRQYMAGMLSTPAQMDSAVRRLHNCEVEHLTYNPEHTRAVLFHSLKNRSCDPFLFARGQDGQWRLDLKALGMGTNHTFGNIWYIHYGRYGESGIWKYMFGFRHVYFYRPRGENGRFDHQGIPYYYPYGLFINHVATPVQVLKVFKGSFADKVIGLKAKDQILSWEDRRYMHVQQLADRLDHVRPGLDIHIVFKRGKHQYDKIVKAPPYPAKGQRRFGFSFSTHGPFYQGKYRNIPVVHGVEPGSPAQELGLKVDDWIIQWQDKTWPLVRDVYQSMQASKPGQPLHVKVFRHNQVIELNGATHALRPMSPVS